jgi:hypothetical protein
MEDECFAMTGDDTFTANTRQAYNLAAFANPYRNQTVLLPVASPSAVSSVSPTYPMCDAENVMAQTTDQQSLVSRAFLVHLRTDAHIRGGRIVGRVEHVQSGDATHFQSLEELVSFMTVLLEPEPNA